MISMICFQAPNPASAVRRTRAYGDGFRICISDEALSGLTLQCQVAEIGENSLQRALLSGLDGPNAQHIGRDALAVDSNGSRVGARPTQALLLLTVALEEKEVDHSHGLAKHCAKKSFYLGGI